MRLGWFNLDHLTIILLKNQPPSNIPILAWQIGIYIFLLNAFLLFALIMDAMRNAA
jgi:hypothetical protein